MGFAVLLDDCEFGDLEGDDQLVDSPMHEAVDVLNVALKHLLLHHSHLLRQGVSPRLRHLARANALNSNCVARIEQHALDLFLLLARALVEQNVFLIYVQEIAEKRSMHLEVLHLVEQHLKMVVLVL